MAEYPYPQYKHGAYGKVIADGVKLANGGDVPQVFVFFGTAPAGQVIGGTKKANVPIICTSMKDFTEQLGYSDDWDKYTLCEAAYVFLELMGIGPVVFVNVLDPEVNKASTASTASLTPSNGAVTITSAADIAIDTIVVKKDPGGSGEETLVKDEDYTVTYDHSRDAVILKEITAGGFGTDALGITYYKMDASTVTSSTVIGSSDGYGLNTGLYTLLNVYDLTGYIPAYLGAPGWSSVKAVHDKLLELSQGINKHWYAFAFSDLPLLDNTTPITVQTAATYKASNGYNKDNEKVCYPMITGTDSKKYHMSVWFAANFAKLLTENDGIPYMTASNTECGIIKDLYFGSASSFAGRVFTDEIINRTLNSNGISSAIFTGGRWVLWGASAASYDVENGTNMNVFDTSMLMLYYLVNDFQSRRNTDVDKPMSVNELRSIVAEEQSRVDALVSVGALTYGKVHLDVSPDAKSDMYSGDYQILFDVTNVPLGKSLTAVASWTDEGFQIYLAELENV